MGAIGEGQAGGTQPIRVFVLDDHVVVRAGLRALLAAEPDIEVVGEAGTAELAINRIPVLNVDVAVLDVRLPDGSGIDVCRRIRVTSPGTVCLMLTARADDQVRMAAVTAGAAMIVLKDALGGELADAIRRSRLAGRFWGWAQGPR
jgi:two-component system, NarL family, response regulator DevR